jgi:hypothetical protein
MALLLVDEAFPIAMTRWENFPNFNREESDLGSFRAESMLVQAMPFDFISAKRDDPIKP